jgi:hypothetical protein
MQAWRSEADSIAMNVPTNMDFTVILYIYVEPYDPSQCRPQKLNVGRSQSRLIHAW